MFQRSYLSGNACVIETVICSRSVRSVSHSISLALGIPPNRFTSPLALCIENKLSRLASANEPVVDIS